MAKKFTRPCKVPKATGDRDGGEGFTRMGKVGNIESAAGSSSPPWGKTTKTTVKKY